MDIKTWAAVIGLAITLGGSAIYLEDRFIQKAFAEEKHAELYKELQIKDLKNKLELVELEIEFVEKEGKEDTLEYAKLEKKARLLEEQIFELEGEY